MASEHDRAGSTRLVADDDDARWAEREPRRGDASARCAECGSRGGASAPRCDRCGIERCGLCPAPCAGCHRLGVIRALMRGEPAEATSEKLVHAGDKTFRFVLDIGPERDVRVRPDAVAVRAAGQVHAHRYYGALAPHVLRRLMSSMGVTTLVEPLVGWVAPMRPYGAGETAAQLAWLLPHADGIEARFRMPTIGQRPFAARPIPLGPRGPLGLPEPIPVGARVTYVLHRQHPEGVACPNCATTAHQHRAVRGTRAVVCAACGRSFEPHA